MNWFCQDTVNRPAITHSVEKCIVPDIKSITPFAQRAGDSIVSDCSMRQATGSVGDGRCDGTFNIPSAIDSATQDAQWYSTFFTPITHALCLAAKCDSMVTSGITALLARCCPAAITRLVVAIIVNAFNRMLRTGAWSHVFIKRLKGLPLLAYFNATFPISRVFHSRGGRATTVHASPDAVFRGLGHAVLAAMATPTSTVAAVPKLLANHDGFSSALASAQPIGPLRFSSRGGDIANNCPSPERLSSQVYEVVVTFGRMSFRHDGPPAARVLRMARQHNLSGYSSLYQNQIAL